MQKQQKHTPSHELLLLCPQKAQFKASSGRDASIPLGSSGSKWQKNQKSLCHRAEGSWPCLGKRQRVQKSLQAPGWSPCRLQVLLQPSHSASARHIPTVCTSVRTADELRAPTTTRRNTLCSSIRSQSRGHFSISLLPAEFSEEDRDGSGGYHTSHPLGSAGGTGYHQKD